MNFSSIKFLGKKVNIKRFSALASFSNFDLGYILNAENESDIRYQLKRRSSQFDYDALLKDFSVLKDAYEDDKNKFDALCNAFKERLNLFPNRISQESLVLNENDAFKIIKHHLDKIRCKRPPKPLEVLSEHLNMFRFKNLGAVTGTKSYFISNEISCLESAILKAVLSFLKSKGFLLIRVPTIVKSSLIGSCGFDCSSKHNPLYFLEKAMDFDGHSLSLSGTAEISLAEYFRNKRLLMKDFPVKVCAVSRCFRAETATSTHEREFYRVHAFTKVEMFGLTANESGLESEDLLSKFVDYQFEFFSSLNLHLRLLEMSPLELGDPASRKLDIECWMPGRKRFGELSSASNCTDFQSRRLNIKYMNDNGEEKFAHTINGTACAMPRLLISLLETFQTKDAYQNILNLIPLFQEFQPSKSTDGKSFKKFKILIIKSKPEEYL